MITSASNGQIKKYHTTAAEDKSPERSWAFCCRRAENVSGGAGLLD